MMRWLEMVKFNHHLNRPSHNQPSHNLLSHHNRDWEEGFPEGVGKFLFQDGDYYEGERDER